MQFIIQKKRLPIYILSGICIVSLVIKISQTDFSESVYYDSLEYNTYAWNITHGIKQLPIIHNIGFPLLLGTIFQFVPDFITSSVLQKLITIIFSTLTIPVFYRFARRIFDWRYSLIGAAMIGFEPHLIQNSTFGITEPQYLLLFISTLFLSTSKNNKLFLLSFLTASLAMITRFEGIVLIPLLLGIFIYKRKFRRKDIAIPVIGIMIFLIPIATTTWLNIEWGTGENVITSKIQHEIAVIKQNTTPSLGVPHQSISTKIMTGIMHLGWSTFPMFILFIPIGLFYIIKNKPINIAIVIALLVLFSITGLLAYLRAFDTRYFVQLYPILTLVSVYGFYNLEKTWIGKRIKNYMNVKWMEIIISIGLLIILFPFVPDFTTNQLNVGILDDSAAFASLPSTAFIYPTYTLSAYDSHGFYTYYKGLCDSSCLTIPDRFNNLDKIRINEYGLDTIKSMNYKILTDRQVDENPSIINNYDTIIVLHNEYVTQNEFDAITHHKHVIYLYPNALYALVQRNQDYSVTLIRGHGYPYSDIGNGFNWKYDNSKLEYNRDCNNFHFYKIDNGYMLNCYPENIINSDNKLWDALSKLY